MTILIYFTDITVECFICLLFKSCMFSFSTQSYTYTAQFISKEIYISLYGHLISKQLFCYKNNFIFINKIVMSSILRQLQNNFTYHS